MKNNKNIVGITLIALVITIIVLLILAGISISMLSGENSILKNAADAKERTGIAQEEEGVNLTFTEVRMELTQGNEINSTTFQNMVNRNLGEGKAEGIINGKSYIIKVQNTRTYIMSSDGGYAKLDKYPIDDNPGVLEQNGNTYTINSIEDLVAFSYNVNSGTELYEGKTVTLGNNLDFKGHADSYVNENTKYKLGDYGYTTDESGKAIRDLMIDESGIGFMPIGGFDYNATNIFKGDFNGNEKSISNLFIKSENTMAGFFSKIDSDLEISNLTIKSCKIIGKTNVAAIVALCENDTLEVSINNCHVKSGSIKGTNSSGIFGYAYCNGNITNCSNSATIEGESGGGTGGICGIINKSITISNCQNYGYIVSSRTANMGGILGISQGSGSGFIVNCINCGDIEGGSLCGRNSSTSLW